MDSRSVHCFMSYFLKSWRKRDPRKPMDYCRYYFQTKVEFYERQTWWGLTLVNLFIRGHGLESCRGLWTEFDFLCSLRFRSSFWASLWWFWCHCWTAVTTTSKLKRFHALSIQTLLLHSMVIMKLWMWPAKMDILTFNHDDNPPFCSMQMSRL